MALPPNIAPADNARLLRDDLEEHPSRRQAEELLDMLRAWRFEVEPDSAFGVCWVVHPVFSRLQMDVPYPGVVDSYVVGRALALVDSLRVLLPPPV